MSPGDTTAPEATPPGTRWAIAAALRKAANAVESGLVREHSIFEPMSITFDGIELHDSAEGAEGEAQRMIDPDGDVGFHPDVSCVSWGVYVAVEAAHVVVNGTPEAVEWAREHGFDEHWDVSLRGAWAAAAKGDDHV